MTKSYMIHARCMRPFIACIDIEADTPDEAITKARSEHQRLYDTAEECNGVYPWDEFAAHDEQGNELLHVLDGKARLRDAAPAMQESLLAVKIALEHYPHWQESMRGHLLAVIDAALAQAQRRR